MKHQIIVDSKEFEDYVKKAKQEAAFSILNDMITILRSGGKFVPAPKYLDSYWSKDWYKVTDALSKVAKDFNEKD